MPLPYVAINTMPRLIDSINHGYWPFTKGQKYDTIMCLGMLLMMVKNPKPLIVVFKFKILNTILHFFFTLSYIESCTIYAHHLYTYYP